MPTKRQSEKTAIESILKNGDDLKCENQTSRDGWKLSGILYSAGSACKPRPWRDSG